jgi:Family of unknown function (DUF5681)
MTSRKDKPAPYQVGYGKPPLHTRFRKGQSGNPRGRPCGTATKRARELVLQEAYRTVIVKEDGMALPLPAIQAVLRSQIELALKGNVQAQRAVLAAIRAVEQPKGLEATFAAIDARAAEAAARAAQKAGQNEPCRDGAVNQDFASPGGAEG